MASRGSIGPSDARVIREGPTRTDRSTLTHKPILRDGAGHLRVGIPLRRPPLRLTARHVKPGCGPTPPPITVTDHNDMYASRDLLLYTNNADELSKSAAVSHIRDGSIFSGTLMSEKEQPVRGLPPPRLLQNGEPLTCE